MWSSPCIKTERILQAHVIYTYVLFKSNIPDTMEIIDAKSTHQYASFSRKFPPHLLHHALLQSSHVVHKPEKFVSMPGRGRGKPKSKDVNISDEDLAKIFNSKSGKYIHSGRSCFFL